jgi:hypothetical protein
MIAGLVVPAIVFFLFLIYFFIVRPWHLRWGTTDEELRLPMPGDSVVSQPDYDATRGISIRAKPDVVWKWIVQIGSNRAGWYSFDWIDNGGVKSSMEILPEFQKIQIGMFIPFTPDQKNGMWVSEFKPNEFVLWHDKQGKATCLWYLYPTVEGCRLLTKQRTKYVWKGVKTIYYLLYDVGDMVMMSQCLKGIKSRAEAMSKL